MPLTTHRSPTPGFPGRPCAPIDRCDGGLGLEKLVQAVVVGPRKALSGFSRDVHWGSPTSPLAVEQRAIAAAGLFTRILCE